MRRFASLAVALALAVPASGADKKPEATGQFELLELKGAPPPRATRPLGRAASRRLAPAGQSLVNESEPNGTSATATPLAGTSAVVRASIFPAADVDFYSFTAATGDVVYAGVQTLFDASQSGDSVLELIDTDGTTVLETDLNDGTFNANSSNIAGRVITAPGIYFLRVRHNVATGTIRPYDIYFQLQSGAPTPEVEPNNDTTTATPMPASGWVSGTITATTDLDFYSITLAAGDTVFLALDMNPERDAAVWNGRAGLGLFGNPTTPLILLASDGNTGSVATDPNSEAFYMTVKDAGTYFVFVDSPVAAGLGATATYTLSASVYPAVPATANCTTYTSTNVPVAIPAGPGVVTSTITVPGNPRIADLDVSINMDHTFMQDLDVNLTSPAGNDNGLFSDIGAATVGGAQTLMNLTLDDEAAVPPAFATSAGFVIQPELAYRLSWFDGENAGGTWTLTIRDDAAGDAGTLNAWSIKVCEPPPPPACAAGFVPTTVFTTDFESGAAGFTHSGTADEWELGLPATVATSTAGAAVAAFNTCNSGVNCWKTDLDNTYDLSSTQDLLSPNINLTGLSGPVVVTWAQRYQMESANFDHASVDYQQVGGATPVRLFEWRDATMSNSVGNPTVAVGESSGWSLVSARADSLAGLNTELRFHLDSDNVVNLGGLAIDDVTVTACRPLSADLSITKTDGVATATPGGSVTYTITASNAGADPAAVATVADAFPAVLSCAWTCVGAGGGTCTAAGAGNINDTTVNLPVGGSVTYTASCTISASATGSLVNTATVSSALADPDPANNSATDTDNLTPTADAAITKTDGVTTATPGGSVTYTITASNAGPSDAPGSTVADTFPASLTCTWTCVGAGGGTCTASGSGNINDTVSLPSGGSATYTASCTISGAATGTLSNTSTVTTAGGVTDPTPGNNSATDTDTLTPSADLAITKTDGVTTVTPGDPVTYTIVASNAGPSDAPGSTVADTFPAALTCTWTCAGAGGGTCTAAGAGNINDTVNLPSGGSVTYTASCALSVAATGTLVNTATVTEPAGVTDPTPGDNSATDTDTVNPLFTCATPLIAVPDGRLTETSIPAGVTFWLGSSLTIGNSYSVEFKNTTGDNTPPGVLTVFSGDDGCVAVASSVTTFDTAATDPDASPAAARVSFTAAGTLGLFHARLVGVLPVSFSFGWSETTMYSPAWSTNGSFNTFYSFQNTTTTALSGNLTFLDVNGVLVSTFPISVGAGQTTTTNTLALGVARNRTGTAKFTHNGPPGALVLEAAIANFAINPAYVQSVKFVPQREAR